MSVLLVLGLFYILKPSPLPKIYIPSDIEWQTPDLDAYFGDFTPVWDKDTGKYIRLRVDSEKNTEHNWDPSKIYVKLMYS